MPFDVSFPPDRPEQGTRPPPHWPVGLVISLAIGVAVRFALLVLAPYHQSPWDHHEYVRWGNQAANRGVLDIYVAPPGEIQSYLPGRGCVTIHHREQYICNYPPLAVYLFTVLGRAHRRLDPSSVSNTLTAHFLYSTPGIIADLLLAFGCLAVVRAAASPRAGRVAFCVAFLMPPLMLDSCFWGQTDSWVLAPAVWMVHAMIRSRWKSAGVLWGTALALKTQAVLLAPIWVFAALDRCRRTPPSHWPGRIRPVLTGTVCAIAWLNLLALPFWSDSGRAWIQNSYVRNLRDEAPRTTLKAFNLWYVDLLRSEDPDTRTPLLGLQKDDWGKALALASLFAAGVLAWRRGHADPVPLLLFSGLWLLLVVMTATRVHERYLLLCLPFLLCVSFIWKSFWAGLVPLVFVASFQVSVYQWLDLGAGTWPEYEQGAREYHARAVRETPPTLLHEIPTFDQAMDLARSEYAELRAPERPSEWTLTILALAATLAVLVAAFLPPRRAPSIEGPAPAP